MTADVPVKPFGALPKKFHVCRITHMALVIGGVSHAYEQILKVRSPMRGEDFLKGVNVQTGGCLIKDSADYLVADYRTRGIYQDAAEQLIVDVSVPISFGLLRTVYIFRNISATLPSGVKYDLRPILDLMLLLVSPEFSAIARSGNFFLVLHNSLCVNVCLYNS